MTYTIQTIAKLMGINPSTLRYYDSMGLLPNIDKSKNGTRIFKDKDIEWLITIECLKTSGMKINDIRKYIELLQQGDSIIEERYNMFLSLRKDIKNKIADLNKALQKLDYKCEFYKLALEKGTTKFDENNNVFKESYNIYKNKLENILKNPTQNKKHLNNFQVFLFAFFSIADRYFWYISFTHSSHVTYRSLTAPSCTLL